MLIIDGFAASKCNRDSLLHSASKKNSLHSQWPQQISGVAKNDNNNHITVMTIDEKKERNRAEGEQIERPGRSPKPLLHDCDDDSLNEVWQDIFSNNTIFFSAIIIAIPMIRCERFEQSPGVLAAMPCTHRRKQLRHIWPFGNPEMVSTHSCTCGRRSVESLTPVSEYMKPHIQYKQHL